ncbi:MAG TPA: exosortase/archaeosortase family protein [Chthoniobacterales bacterium]|nr:exosortase/archaeosortase family protein [Chthoniobacterales bacterium]
MGSGMDVANPQTGAGSAQTATTTPLESSARLTPVTIFLIFTIVATLIAFFGVLKLYAGESIMVWAWKHWLPNLNQEYGKLVIPISVGLVWYHWKKIKRSKKSGSSWGMLFVGGGTALVLLGIRAVEPRIVMLSIPPLIFGIVLFLWGREVARILAFPIGFLWFMIPVGALQQTSFRLQFLITGAMQTLSPMIGVKLNVIGTTLNEVTGAWGFDIAEGCSGIRSLVAIIMLTAIYAHIFEKIWWKKIVLVAFSLGFAVIANIGRIFTIILIAKMGYPTLAGGIYHEYSGFISFPVALLAMLLFHKLLNLRSPGNSLLGKPEEALVK